MWVAGLFAVHTNKREHTAGGVSMGREFPIVNSTKQKTETQRSTETGVVSVDDCIHVVLWTRYWLDAQGYDVLITFSFKTIKVLLFWKIMTRLQAASTQIT